MFTLTPSAIARIKNLNGNDKNKMLRIAVQGGGCSGFQYVFLMDDCQNKDDHVFSQNDAVVIIDDVSFEFLKNGSLDFQEDLAGAMFVIRNPNAASGCGCGNSFTL